MPDIQNGDLVTVSHPLYGAVSGTVSGVIGSTFLLHVEGMEDAIVCGTPSVIARYQKMA